MKARADMVWHQIFHRWGMCSHASSCFLPIFLPWKACPPNDRFFLMNISVIITAIAAFFIFRRSFRCRQYQWYADRTYRRHPHCWPSKWIRFSHDRILLLQTSDMIGAAFTFFSDLYNAPLNEKILPEYTPVGGSGHHEDANRYIEAFSGKKQSVKP